VNDTPALKIDVVSDVVCPWCFIGKRQLEQAIERWQLAHPHAPAPQVVWHPFQLNPDLPVEGVTRADYLKRKFGRSDTSRLYENVRRAAGEVGITLNLDGIARQPNSLRAHALMQLAGQTQQQQSMAEALFNAYFIDGRDLTDDAVLTEIALGAGLDAGRVRSALTDAGLHREVAEQDLQAREAGIGGVPFFIVNGEVPVSGAAGSDQLLRAFEAAA
jgi:predicted DsbA family dithiol-disulfide isomerase